MGGRVAIVAARLAHENASVQQVLQQTTNMRELLPYQKAEAQAKIDNLMESTAGKNCQTCMIK